MSAYGGHPERKTIAAYLARTAGAADMLWVHEHLQSCIGCYRIMAEERFPEPCRAPFTVSTVTAPARAGKPGTLPQRIVGRLARRLLARHRAPQRVPESPPPLTVFPSPFPRSQPAAVSPVSAPAAAA
jgi:hypothetical protein